MLALFPILWLTAACGKKEVKVDTVPATPPATDRYQATVSRLPEFLDRGFVVSKAPDGSFQHQGDSLIFSGLALYSLSCQDGEPIAAAFAKMLADKDGGAYRHPDRDGEEVSLDGLLGLYRGITKRVMACGEKDRWAPLMINHKARVAASLPAEFNLVADVLLYKLGLHGKPDFSRKGTLAFEVAAWADLVKASRRACYRIHLGLLALQTLAELGEPVSGQDLGRFANATSGTGMATTDHFCGRGGLQDYLENFQYDLWQYRHQRCEVWETPDGNGLKHPAIDFLVGYADLYGAPK